MGWKLGFQFPTFLRWERCGYKLQVLGKGLMFFLLFLALGLGGCQTEDRIADDPARDWTDPDVWNQMLAREPYWIYSMLYRNRTKPYHCQETRASTKNFTIVTALIDIKRGQWPRFRRKFENYLHYSVPLLQLNIPLVIFVEPKVKSFVEFYRRGKEHLTKIILIDIHDLEYYREYDVIRDIMTSSNFRENNPVLNHPEGFSTDYNIVVNSKISLLFQASQRNFFGTGYFYWIDMGYGHGRDIFPDTCFWSPHSLTDDKLSDKITFIQLSEIDWMGDIFDLYKKEIPPLISGGFFGGPQKGVENYYFLHKAVFMDFLQQRMIDDDQTMAIACYLKRPELFHFVWGTWYDAFKLFH